MLKKIGAFLVLAMLAACSGARKSDNGDTAIDNPRGGDAIGSPPVFALPGVPLKNELLAEELPALPETPAGETKAEAPAAPPDELAPAAAVPAETKPAVAAPAAGKDLDFHIAAGGKYAAKKKYRSAAAEYGAALLYLPAKDPRAVYLLEREGAMMLKAGDAARAQGYFQASIESARELNVSGKDLANSHLGLGYCLEKAGKVPDAIANYQKAMELSSNKTIKARLAKTISDLKKTP